MRRGDGMEGQGEKDLGCESVGVEEDGREQGTKISERENEERWKTAGARERAKKSETG